MRTPLAALPLALLSLAAGCATAPKGPGFVDPRVAAAAQTDAAKEVEIVLDGSGAMSKVAVEMNGGDQAPAAVRKLAETTFPGGTITEYEQEYFADGSVVHEVEVKTADGKECEVSATEAGTLRYTECKLKTEEVSEAVKKAIDGAAAGAEITEAETRKMPDGAEEVRVEVKQGGRQWYFRVKPDGTIIERSRRLEAEITIPVK